MHIKFKYDPANNYLFKVNNRNTRKRCEICSQLTKKAPHRRQWHRSGVFIVNFEHIPYPLPVFLLLTVDYYKVSQSSVQQSQFVGYFCTSLIEFVLGKFSFLKSSFSVSIPKIGHNDKHFLWESSQIVTHCWICFRKLLQLLSQSALTCSKLTIGTLEQGVKYVQS